MSGPRDTAYAALRAGAPRPVIAGDAVEAFGARFATQNGSWARLGSPADIPGAAGVGMPVFWHNRAGMPFLADAARPFLIADTLDPLRELVR